MTERRGESGVSVIVPSLRDDAALATLLSELYALEPAPLEVIVVDGAASDVTAELCRKHGAVWLASPPGRGPQLACGAAYASGEVLWFVHADAGIAPRSLEAIGAAVRAGAIGGYFRFRFGGVETRVKRFLERCIAWRCRHGVPYGDQALFATRAAYARAGGFAAQPLFEEVSLVKALRRIGPFVALDLPVTVSPRRWEHDGYLRRTLMNRLLALGHAVGISPARLVRAYAGVRR
jgi:rSAM/selenodomain-associated transferase 2